MYHLLDKDQLDLDGFNAFGPGSVSGKGAGAGATTAATQAAPSVAAAARPKSNAKAVKGGAGAGAAGKKGEEKGSKGKVTASTTGTQRGKAGAPVEGMDREEMRRLGLYAAFLLPLADSMCPNRKRANVSVVTEISLGFCVVLSRGFCVPWLTRLS